MSHTLRLPLLEGQHVDLHDVAVCAEQRAEVLLDGCCGLEASDVDGVVARGPLPELRLLDLQPLAARDLAHGRFNSVSN